jgi:hypothetical protein
LASPLSENSIRHLTDQIPNKISNPKSPNPQIPKSPNLNLMSSAPNNDLFEVIKAKGQLKQSVYQNTVDSINLIRKVNRDLLDEFNRAYPSEVRPVAFNLLDVSDFELQLQFAGDVLVFSMHTNIFEFSRYHEVMSTNYVREDKSRSYCGIINIYNFLADSFKYNRVNDVGYLIGRLFINKDKSYFIEGKREVGLLYNNFGQEVFNESAARKLVESAISYAINFDLLTPPFDSVKEISLMEVKSIGEGYTLKTGKRLGFRFLADKE